MTSLEKEKETLDKKQCLASFYKPITEETLKKIDEAKSHPETPQQTTANPTPEPSAPRHMFKEIHNNRQVCKIIARGECVCHTSYHNTKN